MITTTPTASVVQLLVETCRDGCESFALAAAEIRDPLVKACLEEMARERQAFAVELEQALADLGEDHASFGDTIASLHRSWLDFRFALCAGDESTILADCWQTESRSKEEYREALEMQDLHPQIRAAVQRQCAAIEASAEGLRRVAGGHIAFDRRAALGHA